MLFNIVRSNSRERFNEVFINLASIEKGEEDGASSVEVKIQRGLFYVHLYSALEKAVNETIEQTILLVKQDAVKNKHYENTFNVISLNSKMQAFKHCSNKNYFSKSIEVFESLGSEERFDLSNTIFSENLQNIWYKTIQESIRSFGAEPINIEPRVRLTIDEVVDKRNAVAHGRETPVSVGERHRSDMLRVKSQEIQLVVEQFISTFEDYVVNKKYINPIYVNEYQQA
ncbi:MAE_28990/MAE_18760 family HEPN-like nuclease [Microbulbifer elongatus]|uniref:MAE_28990/MAE_18760 family HEPN-like nuclease n=1 Tax=Microbulbifer elongatus TaxID=86173 RepID=UPI001CFE2D5C|nr:MAE_28990/MAE_18760 family HEPN-like nuclease [Microbulbifer elongatus]